jgi:hypothetical protein
LYWAWNPNCDIFLVLPSLWIVSNTENFEAHNRYQTVFLRFLLRWYEIVLVERYAYPQRFRKRKTFGENYVEFIDVNNFSTSILLICGGNWISVNQSIKTTADCISLQCHKKIKVLTTLGKENFRKPFKFGRKLEVVFRNYSSSGKRFHTKRWSKFG